jgi:hypothetical protein
MTGSWIGWAADYEGELVWIRRDLAHPGSPALADIGDVVDADEFVLAEPRDVVMVAGWGWDGDPDAPLLSEVHAEDAGDDVMVYVCYEVAFRADLEPADPRLELAR